MEFDGAPRLGQMSQWRSDARTEYDGWAEPGSLMVRLRRSYISREVFPIRPPANDSLFFVHNIKARPFKYRLVTSFFDVSVTHSLQAPSSERLPVSPIPR